MVVVLNVCKGSFKGDSLIYIYFFVIGKSLWYKWFGRECKWVEKEEVFWVEDEVVDSVEYKLLDMECRG